MNGLRTLRSSRSGAAVLLPLLLLTVAACGGDEDKKPAATPTSAVAQPQPQQSSQAPALPPGRPLSRDQLKAALVTAADLPAGFTVSEVEADKQDEAPEVANEVACRPLHSLIASQQSGNPVATAGYTFELAGPSSSFASGRISAYAAGDAQKRFQAGVDALAGCASYTTVDSDGDQHVYQIRKVEEPAVGDVSIGLRVEADGFVGALTVMRVDDSLFVVGNGGLGGADPARPAAAVFEAQAKKLRAAARS